MARVTKSKYLGSFITITTYVILWQLLCWLFDVSKDILPTPLRILLDLYKDYPYYLTNTKFTCKIIAVGFTGALLLAPPLAFVTHKWKLANQILEPLVVLSQVTPKPALIPLFIVWFGFTSTPNYLITFLISFFPIFAGARLGLTRINKEHLKMMEVWGATTWQKLKAVEFPSVLPFILSSMKVASLYAVIGAITSEILISKEGLGYVIQFSAINTNMDKAFGGIVISGVLGVTVYFFAELLERRGNHNVSNT